ncbi:MAG: DNA methyltransferase [Flavobacteriaceae bacterium]|nr:DNA methyltransferase [Flavobacteriaceae bacterium]
MKRQGNLNVENRTIFVGDNLEILPGINSSGIDLIYLDPPFNTKKTYHAPIGSSAEGASFVDTFHEEDVKNEWLQTIYQDYPDLAEFLEGIKGIGPKSRKKDDLNFCYCAYMAIRLIELHRVLKPSGNLFLHCDGVMVHYLKLIMDCIFGHKNFRNQIVWKRTAGEMKGSQHKSKKLMVNTDYILWYAKNKKIATFNTIYQPLSQEKQYDFDKEIEKLFPLIDEQKRRYTDKKTTPIFSSRSMGARPNLCYTYKGITNPHPSGWRVKKERLIEMDKNNEIIWRKGKSPIRKKFADNYKGKLETNIWTDIPNLTGGQEYLGWPTQKPIKLLERIIEVGSNKDDVVLDPFCGCATTCFTSEKMDRKWIGIDVSEDAYNFVKKRLEEAPEALNNLWKISEKVKLGVERPKRTDQGKDYKKQKYVYVFSNPAFKGIYKVGIAKNWKSRLYQYQIGAPLRDYKKELVLETPYYRQIEKHIHD